MAGCPACALTTARPLLLRKYSAKRCRLLGKSCESYRFRLTKSCISRVGSSVRNARPKAPIETSTDCFSCDADVAGGGHFEPAAEAPARHARDDGRGEGAHGFAELGKPRDERLRGG